MYHTHCRCTNPWHDAPGNNRDPAGAIVQSGQTALHHATASGAVDVVKLLITMPDAYVDHRDSVRVARMHSAATRAARPHTPGEANAEQSPCQAAHMG